MWACVLLAWSNEPHIRPNDCWPTPTSRRLFQGHIWQISGCCLSLIIRAGFPLAFSDLLCGSPLKGHKVKQKINQQQNGGRATQIDVDKSATSSGLLAKLFFCPAFILFRGAACNL